jgi:hypothetical protein
MKKKLKEKNKLNDTFIFWQKKKKKKEKGEEKCLLKPNHHHCAHAQHQQKKVSMTLLMPPTDVVDSLERASHEPITFLIIFILIKRSNCPVSNLLITKKKSIWKEKKVYEYKFNIFLLLSVMWSLQYVFLLQTET